MQQPERSYFRMIQILSIEKEPDAGSLFKAALQLTEGYRNAMPKRRQPLSPSKR